MKLKPTLLRGLFAGMWLWMSQVASAQLTVNATDSAYIRQQDQEYHSAWRKGNYPLPSRPRDMWQVGIGGGSFLISGDVKSQFGWGSSIHFRKSIGYVLSLKLEYMFGQARGLNYQAAGVRAQPDVAPFSNSTNPLYGANDPFYFNYKIGQYHAVSFQTAINLNNLRFHKPSNKWSLNLLLGVGANMYNTKYDALDANGNKYDFTQVANNLDASKLADRRTIRDNVKSILDDKYETPAQRNTKNAIFIGKGDNALTMRPMFITGFSLEYLITPRLSIAMEHQVMFSADDFLDGKNKGETGALTSNVDIPHYTSLRLGFHLGKKSKRIQPLWFVNPLVSPMKDIADLKKKLDDDWFKDDDKDGVPNKLDEEKNTEPDAIVDTKGRTKDSDGDGVPDHKDFEPFSPPGYATNDSGIAAVPRPIMPEDVKVDGNRLVIGNEVYEPLVGSGGPGGSLKDWYLPMIHFDVDKYNMRPEAISQMAHVAEVMSKYKDIKIVVHGHTDSRASDQYNDMLSYNRAMSAVDYLNQQYGISKDRFIVQYNGKRKSLIGLARREEEHFMNRRVEFYVANGNEKSQPRPSDPSDRKRKWKY